MAFLLASAGFALAFSWVCARAGWHEAHAGRPAWPFSVTGLVALLCAAALIVGALL